MKKLILFTLLLVSFCSFSQTKQIFEAPNLKEIIKTHKTVAIIPMEISITFKKKPQNYDSDAIKEQEKKLSQDIQASLFTYLLDKSDKYTVQFQDIEKTNLILKKAGIIENLSEHTKDEIAKILGVDAIISGKFEMQNTKSEAGAIASVFLLGFGSNTGTGEITLNIYEANSGDMIWRYHNYKNDSIFSSTNEMIEKLMKKIARNFPYEK